MHRRNTRVVLAGLVAIVGLLAGCGGSSDTTADDTSAQVEETPTAAQEATAEPSPAATAAPTPTDVPATPTTEPEPTATPVPPTPEPPAQRTTIGDLLAGGRVLNIAHAGGDQASPHSTMFAFKRAVEAGADVLEIDVQLSADGELVVHHDLTVEGTTNGAGPVIDLTLAELQALDNAHWFAEDCWPCRDLPDDAYLYRGIRTGEQPPPDGYTVDDFRIITVRELAEQFPTLPFDIEIKGDQPQSLEVATALAELLNELDMNKSAIVVSFDDEVVAAFKEAAPDVATSPGQNELTFWILTDVPLGDHRVVQVPPFFETLEIVNADFIAKAAEEGVDVWVWPNDASTQENAEFYTSLVDLGVDGVIAGRPAEMEAARS